MESFCYTYICEFSFSHFKPLAWPFYSSLPYQVLQSKEQKHPLFASSLSPSKRECQASREETPKQSMRVTNPISSGDLLFVPDSPPKEMARPPKNGNIAFLENFLWIQQQHASVLQRGFCTDQIKIPNNDHESQESLERGGPYCTVQVPPEVPRLE